MAEPIRSPEDPMLAVVLVSPGGHRPIAKTVACLEAQTARDRLEIVIVAPSAAGFDPDTEPLNAFQWVQLVEVGKITSTGSALAAGFRRATAPLVACAEEHSYPNPEWADALIVAHQDPWMAVGAALENANPATLVSWVHLFSDFGPSVAPVEGGETTEPAGHHTSYRRRALLRRYEDRLERMLEMEWVLHADMRAHGDRLGIAPRAISRHLNVSRLGSQVRCEYHGGRMFGAARGDVLHWSALRRAGYVLGAPAILVIRLIRILGEIRRSGRRELMVRIVPTLLVALLANVAGQASGYALGAGRSTRKRVGIELERHLHLNRSDRAAFERESAPPPAAAADRTLALRG